MNTSKLIRQQIKDSFVEPNPSAFIDESGLPEHPYTVDLWNNPVERKEVIDDETDQSNRK